LQQHHANVHAVFIDEMMFILTDEGQFSGIIMQLQCINAINSGCSSANFCFRIQSMLYLYYIDQHILTNKASNQHIFPYNYCSKQEQYELLNTSDHVQDNL
jgi:hypothetical protein